MMNHVEITTGQLGEDTIIKIDGQIPDNVAAFQVIGESPDHPTRLILTVEPDSVTINGPMEVQVEPRPA